MFEEKSSQSEQKPILPKVTTTETASSSWLTKISHMFSMFKKGSNENILKKKLHQLEVARDAEKKILLEQRNFYEKLFSRSTEKKHKRKLGFFNRKKKALEPLISTSAPQSPPLHVTPPLVVPRPHLHPTPPTPPSPLKAFSVPPVPLPSATVPTPPPAPQVVEPVLQPPVPLTIANAPTPTSNHAHVTPATVVHAPTNKKHPLPPVPPVVSKKAFSLGFFSNLFSKNLVAKLAEERKREEAWQERNSVEQRFWQPANGFNPNLIKDQEIVFFNWHENILVLSLSLVMCCLAISLTYVGLLIWQKERIEATKSAFVNVTVIDNQIIKSEQEVDEVKKFNTKLRMVSSLLDNHIHWTNFLTLLEFTTLKDVYYQRFSGDVSGEYTIPAVASSLEAISLQLDVMKKYDKVQSVSPDTGQTSADGRSVQFNLGLTVDPTVFTKK